MSEGCALSYEYGDGAGGGAAPTSFPAGKTRITIRLDDDILHWFRNQVTAAGRGSYQALINSALREHMLQRREPLEETLRRVVREELERKCASGAQAHNAGLAPLNCMKGETDLF